MVAEPEPEPKLSSDLAGLKAPESVSFLDTIGLWIARLVAPLLGPLGVEPQRFTALVDVRMKLGRRRKSNDGRPTGSKGQFVTLAISLVVGCFAAVASSAVPHSGQAITIGLAITGLMAGLFQALDVGSLLFDPAEGDVVLPTPTSPRTAYAARLAHGLWGQGWMLAGMTLPLVIYGFFFRKEPLFALVAAPGVLGVAATMFAALVILLLLLARGKDPARLQSMAVYVQVGVLAVFYGSLQVFGGTSGLLWDRMQLDLGIAGIAFPPAWYGGLLSIFEGQGGGLAAVQGALAVFGPALAFILALRIVRTRHLAATGSAGTGTTAGTGRARGTWVHRLANGLGLRPLQRAGFELTGHLAGREHSFRQRTWPSLVYPVVFGGGTLIRDPEFAQDLAGIWVLMPAILLPAILIHARYTRNPGALWILSAAPVAQPAQVRAGSRKLFLVTIALGPSLAFALVWALMVPRDHLPSVLGTVGLAWALAVWVSVGVERRLPFSEHAPSHTRPEGMGFVLLAMFLGTMAFVATLAFELGDGLALGTTGVCAVAFVLGWRRLGDA